MPMIKDPTFNVYAKGGNVENRKNTPKKDELIKLAKDEKDILFDVEGEIIDILRNNYDKEKVPGQSFLDWLGTKDREYLIKIEFRVVNRHCSNETQFERDLDAYLTREA